MLRGRSRTGRPLFLAPDKAKLAVETVLNFAKTRLPAPIATQLESALTGGGAGDLAGAAKGMGVVRDQEVDR